MMEHDRHNAQAQLGQLAELARETFERQVRLGREYADLARQTVTGDGDRAAAGRAYLTSVRRESERYWREVSGLGIGYAADVAALGVRVSSAVARDLRQAMNPKTAQGAWSSHVDSPAAQATHAGDSEGRSAESPAKAAAEVALHAPAGHVAQATITVANRHPRARRIVVSAGPIVDRDATEIAAEITVDPKHVTVPAGEERTVTLSLAITEDAFVSGLTYRAVVEISGGEEATVTVHVTRDPD